MKRLAPAARRAAVTSVVVLVLLFVVTAWVARRDDFSGLDESARTLVHDGRPLALERPLRVVGALALGWVLLPVTVAGSVVLWRRRQRAVAVALPVIGLTAVAVLGLTKWIVNKPRPSLRGYGFPSGHVFAATVFVVLVVYLLWRFEASRPRQHLARALGIAFILAVGYSRLYVNAHWLSDVGGGLLAGIVYATVAMLVMDRHAR